jgi:hypothetical protein
LSELVIEHPISLIETLLKAGKGDKGRLLYLKNAIKTGKTIYESDQKYLHTMQNTYPEMLFQENTSHNLSQNNSVEPYFSEEIKNKSTKKQKQPSQNKTLIDSFDFELETIQNSLSDLKTKESKIKDNLQLLSINHEILSQTKIDQSNSFGSFSNLSKNAPSDLFELIKNSSNLDKVHRFRIKKHNAMTYASAGLFSLWFAGHQNLIDLGVFQGLSLGFSAGAAVSAGLFYKKNMKSI